MRPPVSGAARLPLSARTASSSLAIALVVVVLIGGIGFSWLSGERTVTLVVDGEAIPTRTHAATVGELLDRVGIAVAQGQGISPAPEAPLVDGMRVEVDRLAAMAHVPAQPPVARPVASRPSRSTRSDGEPSGAISDRGSRIVTRTESIPHATVEEPTDDLPRGERREVRPGSDGVREIVEAIVEIDGAEASREVVGARVVSDPVDRVVAVGTADPDPTPAPTPEPQPTPSPMPMPTPEPAPPAPAPQSAPEPEPEPSPAPAAEPAPQPEPAPEEQPPPPANVEEGGASWYDNPAGGYTAAHRTLPKGTVVTVTNLANGKQVQVTINDRGPYVRGRIIDLNRQAFAEIASTSSGVVRVRIEW